MSNQRRVCEQQHIAFPIKSGFYNKSMYLFLMAFYIRWCFSLAMDYGTSIQYTFSTHSFGER